MAEYRQIPTTSSQFPVAAIPANVPGVVHAARATLAYTDTVAKALFTIPAGAVIIDWIINVTTVFNSDGTDFVDLGITGTAEKFAADLDVSATGLKTGVVTAQIGAVQETAQPVLGIYAAGGSAASTGAMVIMCRYFTP
jgi:hypothetical protein